MAILLLTEDIKFSEVGENFNGVIFRHTNIATRVGLLDIYQSQILGGCYGLQRKRNKSPRPSAADKCQRAP